MMERMRILKSFCGMFVVALWIGTAHAQLLPKNDESASPPYGVIFEVILDSKQQVESLKITNVVPLRDEVKGQKSVDIPDEFIDAVREKVTERLKASTTQSARKFYTYFFFDPALPALAIGKDELGQE